MSSTRVPRRWPLEEWNHNAFQDKDWVEGDTVAGINGLVWQVVKANKVPKKYWDVHTASWCLPDYVPEDEIAGSRGGVYGPESVNRTNSPVDRFTIIPAYYITPPEPTENEWGEVCP